MQYAPTRVRAKFVRFHISAPGYPKNAPDFTLPNKDTPKTRPVLGLNLRRGLFRGVCNTPLHGFVQNLSGFTFPHTDTPKTRPVLYPNHRRRIFGGVCNTPLHGYMQNLAGFIFPHPDAPKNAPDFIFPHPDTPKTRPVLDANLRRGYLRGVCNTPLHGYMQNLTSFTFPHLNTPKTHPISPFPIRIRPNPARF